MLESTPQSPPRMTAQLYLPRTLATVIIIVLRGFVMVLKGISRNSWADKFECGLREAAYINRER